MRAVIYCRCSTEEESQADALRKQIYESLACVEKHGWLLADRYIEAKSGTTVKGRDEYQRLYHDLNTDKFDIIVIKSQDRLMRNVKDWYLFVDRLVTRGKRLYIYLEQKFYSSDDALITGIKAIMAEEYSRELSKKINNAHHNRQKNGGKAMLTSRTFGYEKLPDGSVRIVKEEAKVILLVYKLCIAGYGGRAISNMLRNQGFINRNGNYLSAARILRIVRNPLYTGTMVMNRRHYDFDSKLVIQNPSGEWIFRENTVPAIISSQIWEKANEAVDKRTAAWKKSNTNCAGAVPGKHQLSGIMLCGRCRQKYYRVLRKTFADPQKKVAEWKCCSYIANGRESTGHINGCNNVHLNEDIIFSLLEQVGNQYFPVIKQTKGTIIEHSMSLLKLALEPDDNGIERRIEEEEKRFIAQKDLLMEKLLDRVINDGDYQRKKAEIEVRLHELQTVREGLMHCAREIETPECRLEAIQARLKKDGIRKAAAAIVLEAVEQIVVYEWYLEIRFHPQWLKQGSLCINYPFPPATERGRFQDKIKIIDFMEQNPKTTAKIISGQLDRPLRMVQNRIAELKKEGYIEYAKADGQTWQVLKPSEILKAEMRAEGAAEQQK